jgi:hypothetical protein
VTAEPWMWTLADAMKAAREQGVDEAGIEAMLQAFERASTDRMDADELRNLIDGMRNSVGLK